MKKQVQVVTILCLLSLLLGVFSFSFFLNSPRVIVMAQENAISLEQAEQKVKTRFEAYDIEEIEYLAEGEGVSPTYNFNVKFKDKDEFCVQVTKDGGYILTIGCVSQNISSLLREQQCLKAVEEFVHQIGFVDLRAIWSSKLGDETVINLAPIINDVIIYPDLLKARVNCKTGDMLSLEARSYLYDYYRGSIDTLEPILSYEQAKESIPEGYEVLEHRLALILNSKDKKCLTYEIKAKYDKYTYFFFVNAINGKIEQVLIAVD